MITHLVPYTYGMPFAGRVLVSLACVLGLLIGGAAHAEATKTTPSGLQVPRYGSLKANKVNGRIGPSQDHPKAFEYRYAGYPVQVIAESRNWIKVRDADGDTSWVANYLLSQRRTVRVLSPLGGTEIYLRARPNAKSRAIAMVQPGAIGSLKGCDGPWRRVAFGRHEGWMAAADLWASGSCSPDKQLLND